MSSSTSSEIDGFDSDPPLTQKLGRAQTGDADNQDQLADFHAERGNLAEAVVWYQKAASAGHARAQCKLGYLYYNGLGVEQSYSAAYELFAGQQARTTLKHSTILDTCSCRALAWRKIS